MLKLFRQLPFGMLGGLLLLLAAACSGTPTVTLGPTATPPPGLNGPEYGAIVITTDLALGSNRVVFGIVDRNGMPVRSQQAKVRALYLPPGDAPGVERASGVAEFKKWPAGPQGVFSTVLEFDMAGFWQLDVTTTGPDGTPVMAQGALQVKEQSDTPSLGSPAPQSVTPTGDEVDDLATITSSTQPDPDLYKLSVHQALASGKPLVVVFATPAFCVSATCGPQVEVLSSVKEKFAGKANFIHVEVFKDPNLIQGGRPPADGTVPAVDEWNLPTEPWTFVVDKEGRISAKFEQFTTGEEIEKALNEVL
ncbi:MAG: thioredoxin family protein [Dehalococcoidia bacterium]|nr:thioredoxin family protein [Dehalococcoidia bacterium]